MPKCVNPLISAGPDFFLPQIPAKCAQMQLAHSVRIVVQGSPPPPKEPQTSVYFRISPLILGSSNLLEGIPVYRKAATKSSVMLVVMFSCSIIFCMSACICCTNVATFCGTMNC